MTFEISWFRCCNISNFEFIIQIFSIIIRNDSNTCNITERRVIFVCLGWIPRLSRLMIWAFSESTPVISYIIIYIHINLWVMKSVSGFFFPHNEMASFLTSRILGPSIISYFGLEIYRWNNRFLFSKGGNWSKSLGQKCMALVMKQCTFITIMKCHTPGFWIWEFL